MKEDNLILKKSYSFAIKIIQTYEYIRNEKKEFVLSKQLLRSGTSIGANVEEAGGAQTPKDFIAKLAIAYKEARETNYWLRLLHDCKYIDTRMFDSNSKDCEELLKIIVSIQKTMKSKLSSSILNS